MAKITWVKPRVVVEIARNEWTPDGHLRHSEFKTLRDDRTVKDVAAYPLPCPDEITKGKRASPAT